LHPARAGYRRDFVSIITEKSSVLPHFSFSFDPYNPGRAGRSPRCSAGDDSMSLIARFLRDDAGATAIEYGLIAAGISVAIIATVAGLGSKLNTTFTSVQNALN
jgi:pilus assembly protein Flp/PilA